MTDKHDGGPAFPCPGVPGSFDFGMSIRDWFAGQALAGVGRWSPLPPENLRAADAMGVRAEWAFEQADAMLAAREGGKRQEPENARLRHELRRFCESYDKTTEDVFCVLCRGEWKAREVAAHKPDCLAADPAP